MIINGVVMSKSDWVEMDEQVVRAARPVLRKMFARIDRRLRKRWRRYQHSKRKQ